MDKNLKVAEIFDNYKNKQTYWGYIMLRFSWINMEEKLANVIISARELYYDWMDECNHCPENDTKLTFLQIGNQLIESNELENFTFEELMECIGTLSKRKKRPQRINKKGTFKDITGQKFGMLTAICDTDMRKGNQIIWKCQCDCGNEVFVPRSTLVRNQKKSCGCGRRKTKYN